MASQVEEIEAMLREAEAELQSAGPEMRPILMKQIESLKCTAQMLRSAHAQLEEIKQHRPPLSPNAAAFFQPVPEADVPAWIPDTMSRGELTEAAMRCADGARVYWNDDSVACAIPGDPGRSLSVAHGLTLQFRSTGALASQSFYERGLLRWSITYHVTGRRETVGYYSSTEPKTYLAHGLHTRYAANGTVVAQAHWFGGVKHGWEKLWEDDGYPIGATLYREGRAVQRVTADGSPAAL